MKLPIPVSVLSQHIAILAKTRSGKSSVARLMVEGLLDDKAPVCIIDPKGDWYGLKSSASGKEAGYPVIIFGGEHADVPINAHSGAAVAELVATGYRPCIIDLGGWMVGERTRFFIDFASTLFKLSKGFRHLVIDEVHYFCPKGKIFDPDAGKALHWANRLASEGLGKGIQMIVASQRPQKVHNDLLTSCETLIAMRVLHPTDRKAVAEWIDGCGDSGLGGQVLGSLAQMARGEGWVWSPEAGFGPKRIQFPLFKTFDSFKPRDAKASEKLKGWASVDLDEVKSKLAAVVKQAEANDPAQLRKRLAGMADPDRIKAWLAEPAPRRAANIAFTAGPERQIAYLIESAAPTAAAPASASRADLNAEYTRGREEGYDAGRLFEFNRWKKHLDGASTRLIVVMLASHPKAAATRNLDAKVRQVCQGPQYERLARGEFRLRGAA